MVSIDWEKFDNACAVQCSLSEIASLFRCTEFDLGEAVESAHGCGLNEYWQKKSDIGRINIRRMQYKLAIEGDKAMLIWLGKQYLGQGDKKESTDGKGTHDWVEDISRNEAEKKAGAHGGNGTGVVHLP